MAETQLTLYTSVLDDETGDVTLTFRDVPEDPMNWSITKLVTVVIGSDHVSVEDV